MFTLTPTELKALDDTYGDLSRLDPTLHLWRDNEEKLKYIENILYPDSNTTLLSEITFKQEYVETTVTTHPTKKQFIDDTIYEITNVTLHEYFIYLKAVAATDTLETNHSEAHFFKTMYEKHLTPDIEPLNITLPKLTFETDNVSAASIKTKLEEYNISEWLEEYKSLNR